MGDEGRTQYSQWIAHAHRSALIGLWLSIRYIVKIEITFADEINKRVVMTNIQYTESPGVPPQSMEDEFLCHKNGSEWWYCTGFINDESGRLFSFQFTLARVRIYFVQFHILMTALTDFETKKHYYAQQPIFLARI